MHKVTRTLGPLLLCPLTCLMLCALTACASPVVRTQTVTVRVPVVEPVPAALTTPIAKPQIAGNTNGALADYILALQRALDAANAKLHEIAGLHP